MGSLMDPTRRITERDLGFLPLFVSPDQAHFAAFCRSSSTSFTLHRSFRFKPNSSNKMQNDEGQNMDLYIPRKCSATNRLITAKDHASVQLNIGHLDENGVYTGGFSTFALCGFIRAQGDADSAIDRLWQKKKAEVRQQ